MAAIDKRSNGRWRVRIRNRRDPTLSKTFTRKTDALKQENNEKNYSQFYYSISLMPK